MGVGVKQDRKRNLMDLSPWEMVQLFDEPERECENIARQSQLELKYDLLSSLYNHHKSTYVLFKTLQIYQLDSQITLSQSLVRFLLSVMNKSRYYQDKNSPARSGESSSQSSILFLLSQAMTLGSS